MPKVICTKCNHATNTAVSRWMYVPHDQADGCFARIGTNDKWERGCIYNLADEFIKRYVNNLCGKTVDW